MSVFELTAKARRLGETGAARAKDFGEMAGLTLKNLAVREDIEKGYTAIGKKYYTQRGLSPDQGFEALCDKITEKNVDITANKARIAILKINAVVHDEVSDPDEAEG